MPHNHNYQNNQPKVEEATLSDERVGLAVAPSHDEIAAKAYEIYAASGNQDGRCTSNWQQAERQLSECSAKQEAEQALENEGGGIVGPPSGANQVNGGAPLRNGPIAVTSNPLVPRN